MQIGAAKVTNYVVATDDHHYQHTRYFTGYYIQNSASQQLERVELISHRATTAAVAVRGFVEAGRIDSTRR